MRKKLRNIWLNINQARLVAIQRTGTFITSIFKSVSRQILRLRHLISLKEKVLLLVIVSYLTGMIFTLFEFNAQVPRKWHPYFKGITYQDGTVWNGWVSDANFVYGFMEMASRGLIFLAAYIAVMNKIPLRIFIVCFWVELSDMLDYWLWRNGPWFEVVGFMDFETFQFEFFYVKLAIIIFFSAREWRNAS